MCLRTFIFNRINTLTKRYAHKYICKMDKAYIRHLTESDQFEISFRCVNETLRVNRQFNFCRKLNEPVSTFLSRVNVNVEKAISKKKKRKKINIETEEEEVIPVTATIIANSVQVNGDTLCKDLFAPDCSNLQLKVFDQYYDIIVNSPWVDSISLPKSILANFPVYPAKFEAVFTDKSLSEFRWYKSRDKSQWVETASGFVYTPVNSDVGCYLKITCTPKNAVSEGPLTEAVADVTVDASPGHCPFETRHEFTKEKLSGKEFRVVSYNILADLYCDSDFTRSELFPYCPPYALNIDYRKQLILKELLGYNADVLCLQEVDRKVFVHDLEPVFTSLNYGSCFSLKGGQVAEGLACIYNASRFNKLESDRIVLGEHIDKDPLFADIWERVSKNEKLKERVLPRTTALQTVLLESTENKELLLVANTHLYFHPDADHIRLLQGGMAIKYLENLLEKLKKKYTSKRISLIFCGDFNSVPECGIYKLYTTGSVPEDFIDYQSNKEERVEGVHLQQKLPLASACGTPKFTNYTAGFADCLDYIFYDKSQMGVVQVVPLPSNEELMQNTALPSVVFPSDHISLICDLRWL